MAVIQTARPPLLPQQLSVRGRLSLSLSRSLCRSLPLRPHRRGSSGGSRPRCHGCRYTSASPRARFSSKVDMFVPGREHVNLSIIGQRERDMAGARWGSSGCRVNMAHIGPSHPHMRQSRLKGCTGTVACHLERSRSTRARVLVITVDTELIFANSNNTIVIEVEYSTKQVSLGESGLEWLVPAVRGIMPVGRAIAVNIGHVWS